MLALLSLASAQDGGLDFDALPSTAVAVAAGDGPLFPWLVVAALAGLVALAGWSGRKASIPAMLDLRRLPGGATIAITATLAIYGLVHALGALAVVMQTRELFTSAEEYFAYLTPARLASLSHAHLMGIATLQVFGALLYTLSRGDGPLPRAICTLAFVGVGADIGSWWLTKYRGGSWEIVSMAAGIACAAAYLWMAFAATRDLWRART